MKTRLLLVLLAVVVSLSNAAAQENVFQLRGKVVDEKGRGIAGVVVNDGVNFVRTADDGVWTLRTDTFVSKFVSISTPAAYNLPAENGLATGFYKSVKAVVDAKETNFVLKKRTRQSDDFYFVAISDPQVANEHDMGRWTNEATPDLRRTIDSLALKREVVGVTLGDLVFDNMPLYSDYKSSVENWKLTLFQCIGNHDLDKSFQDLHNMRVGTPAYAEMRYGSYFGPTDYSFNIGKTHFITLKNINYLGNKKYVEHITDAQLAWLERDLSYVPKGSLVIVNMHAAAWNKEGGGGNVRNAAKLKAVLSGYNVHLFCGHTHFFQNIEVSKNLFQHNIGAACGTWWKGKINRCGTPYGYMIVDVRGSDISWKYKSIGKPLSCQMRLYDRGEFKTQPDCVVANVWDVDSKSRVEWWQDGVAMGEMQRFVDVDAEYASRYDTYQEGSKTYHLFRCTPKGDYKEIKVRLTNRFGETFTETIKK